MIVFLCMNKFDVVVDFDDFLRLRIANERITQSWGWSSEAVKVFLVGKLVWKYGWMASEKYGFNHLRLAELHVFRFNPSSFQVFFKTHPIPGGEPGFSLQHT